jgi:hypothetical protein
MFLFHVFQRTGIYVCEYGWGPDIVECNIVMLYYSLIVALVSVPVLSKFLSVYLVGFVTQVLPCCPPGSFQANGY